MASRYRTKFSGLAAVLAAFVGFAAQPAQGRLPWAATSGTHFVAAVVNADNYRMKAAALALKRSPSADVRDFARALWENALEDTRRLQWTLTTETPYFVLWTQITPEYMFVLDELVALNGDDFDQRFIAQQTASLSQALALAEGYARAGDDLVLKEFAARSIPQIKAQLDSLAAIRTEQQTLALR